MISRKGRRWAGLLVLAAGLGTASASAHAQVPPSTEETDRPAIKDEAGAEPEEADIKDLELDWSQLNVDASTLMTPRGELKASLAPRAGANHELIWSSRDQPNGSAVSVNQSVSTFGDAKVGADKSRNRAGRRGRRSRLPAPARSGTRPRSKPGSIPRRTRASSALPLANRSNSANNIRLPCRTATI